MIEPSLVDFDKIFKRKKEPIKIEYPKIDYWPIFLNCSCLILLCIGFYILYSRSENKYVNEMIHEKNIYILNNQIKDYLDNRED